jgi:hypothetical protein
MHLDLMQRGASPTRGRPVDVPSIDGHMLAVGSELNLATSWCARKVNRHNAIQETRE